MFFAFSTVFPFFISNFNKHMMRKTGEGQLSSFHGLYTKK